MGPLMENPVRGYVREVAKSDRRKIMQLTPRIRFYSCNPNRQRQARG